MTTDRYLTIYLRDHLAMGRAGVDFVRRMAANNEDNELGELLEDFEEEFLEEVDALERAMELLEVEPSQLKMAGAWLAEKAGRLKFNGEFTRYSPLSRLLEIEFLTSAVRARRGLWETMQDAGQKYPDLRELPIDRFVERAGRQIDQLEAMHQNARRGMLESGQRRDRPR